MPGISVRFTALTLIIAALQLCIPAAAEPSIGFLFDGPAPANEALHTALTQEITSLTKMATPVAFPGGANLTADWTLQGVQSALDQLLADSAIDLIITPGYLASTVAATRANLPKPVIAPYILDAKVLALTSTPNLAPLAPDNAVQNDLQAFKELCAFDNVTILADAAFLQAAPAANDGLLQAAKALGLQARVLPVAQSSLDQTLTALGSDTQAVYLCPLPALPEQDHRRLANQLQAGAIPSFTYTGINGVERGFLATTRDKACEQRLIRRTGLAAQRILAGAQPASLPPSFTRPQRLALNMATARAIDFSPPWRLLIEAELLHDQHAEGALTLDLATAVQQAVDANLDLIAAERQVAAGEADIREARSMLLPQIEAKTLGLIIDDDRAASAMGSQPERTWTGSVTLTQIIYAEPAWANVAAQRHIQRARELDRDRIRLDIALEASKAYLNLLRTQANLRIRKYYLDMTRSHLETATIRKETGAASPSEVYRWESEIAKARKDVVAAEALQHTARIAVNRVRHLPLEQPLITTDIKPEDLHIAGSESPLYHHLDTPADFEAFRDFLVHEGIARAPELQQLDAAIAAQERGLRSSKRSFYTPVVALQAEVSERFSKSGAGSTGGLGIPIISIPQADDTSWNVGVQASLPITTGGARTAAVHRATQQLEGLKTQRASAAEKIEQWIRSAILAAHASSEAIRENRQAAEAAHKGLDLVSDAYASGIVSIVDLLDAQTAAEIADQLAADSIYDYMLNMMDTQRAANSFLFFMDAEEQSAWFERFTQFIAQPAEK